MMTTAATIDCDRAVKHLSEHGYVVLENVLSGDQLAALRRNVDALMVAERRNPYEPSDGPALPDDDEIERYLADSYDVSNAELARMMCRIRHTRSRQLNTPWPVPVGKVLKNFLHLPTLFDQDKSQRIWNLLNKGDDDLFARLAEHPVVLTLVRRILGDDCVLADASATSIGTHTGGGAWHVDVPLGQLPEPLPDFPLTMQNAWMLDDFTADNGGTRVAVASHKLRRKPPWSPEAKVDREKVLAAPAGSVAVWLSSTWHRSGPNYTDHPRRAILYYYSRSWVKPFADFVAGITPERAAAFSPTVRYVIGYAANGIVRG